MSYENKTISVGPGYHAQTVAYVKKNFNVTGMLLHECLDRDLGPVDDNSGKKKINLRGSKHG